MNLAQIDKCVLVLGSIAISAGLCACGTPAVGAPCLPEGAPAGGFNEQEAYVESSSVQCETRVCLVYQLDGDPSDGCVPKDCPIGDMTCTEHKCATPQEVGDRVYCSCRCDAGDTGFAECECPDGFECKTVLDRGGPGVRGGYCAKLL